MYRYFEAIPDDDYPEAFMMAGKHLQSCIDNSSRSGFRWIKSQFSYPRFCDLAIAIDRRIYAILLVPVTRQKKADGGEHAEATFEIPSYERKVIMEESKRYGLIPVVFPLWVGVMQPLTKGWNLFSLPDLEAVNPDEQEPESEPVAMSDWEKCNFRVTHVMQDMVRNKLSIRSYHDDPDLLPNIWFVDEDGNRAWAAVIPMEDPQASGIPTEIRLLRLRLSPEFRGYFARVGITRADGLSGDAIPRGAPLFVSYKGLEPAW